MKLLILGATGRTGREVVDLGLARGHQLTAFVRSPHKLGSDSGLRAVGGDPLDVDQLAPALVGHDAVISALGVAPRDAFRPFNFMTESAGCTVEAMQRAAVSRIAIVSAAVLFPPRDLFARFFCWLLKHHARDLRGMESALRSSDLDWTIVRPPRLIRARDDGYRTQRGTLPPGNSLSFRALAACLLDCVETSAHEREILGVSRRALPALTRRGLPEPARIP